MRLKSEIWVQAFLRQNEVQGRFGAVLRKGASEAGAVFLVVNHQNGTSSFLEPPPGSAYDDDGERRFRLATAEPVQWDAIAGRIARASKIDTDIWIVEVEDRKGLAGITPVQD